MAYDYKKEQKNIYGSGKEPSIVELPAMHYVAVKGSGDPNDEHGDYSAAVGILYAISYMLKMSYKGSREIHGFFEYVVPPLEGLWWMGNGKPGVDYTNKAGFQWVSMIRLPDFVTEEDFLWAKEEVFRKKRLDVDKAEFFRLEEGLCVQCMHVGSYDDEPATVARMEAYLEQNNYVEDFAGDRRHHEIYLKDPRKTAPEKLMTVIRHPVRNK